MKIKYYILLLSILSLTACKNDVDEIWGELPTEKVEKARKALSETLISAENGWKISYYPDPKSFGAYNFLMKFDGKKVHMQGDELFPNGVHSSLYSVTSIQGPTLVFDSYNIISHLSDPMMFIAGSGLNGDNEFVWQSTAKTQDTIVFKGKKSGSIIEFIKFNNNWDQHFEDIQRMTDLYTTGSMDRYFKQILMEDGSEVLLCGYDNIRRTINPIIPFQRVIPTPESSDSIVQIINGVNITKTGISFHDPLNVNGKYIQNLTFDETSGFFKVIDAGVNAIVKPVNEPNIVFEGSNKHIFNPQEIWAIETMDGRIESIVSKMAQKVDDFYGVWFYPNNIGNGFSLYVLYVDYEINSLRLAAGTGVSLVRSSTRSDKYTIRPQAWPPSISGDYASTIKDDLTNLISLIAGENRRTGIDYIVIPQDDGSYMLGSTSSNTSFSLIYKE